MDDIINKLSQFLAWLKTLDSENFLILAGGLIAFLFLLNWLWKKGRDRGTTERSGPSSRPYAIPSQPLYPPKRSSVGNGDIRQYNDVSYKALPLMSQTEINFWCLLYEAAPGYHIFPQVAASALLTIESPDPQHFKDVLKVYSASRIDFVVCDAQLNVVALVELDDRSHDDKKEKDGQRDFISGQAGYKTVRFDCRQWPNVEKIKKKIFY